MKKLFLFVMCAISFTALNAQKYYVYGVDFTKVKVHAAQESVQQFVDAFDGINRLLVSEPQKYDFSRMLGCIPEMEVEPMIEINSAADFSDLITLKSKYEDIDCAKVVESYSLPQKEGIGVVLIAKFLDKPKNTAIYDLVTFDIATRDIISKKEVKGKAGGFGLRNFWAGSIARILKSTKL